MNRLLGKWDVPGNGERVYKIYTDNDTFSLVYPNNIIDLSFNEAMENWAVILNSPWADHNIYYRIEKNAYFKKEFVGCPDYICEYSIVGYEHMTASIYGYGNTPEEALTNCKDMYTFIQQTYNPDNESM